jgi:hypothetical protein
VGAAVVIVKYRAEREFRKCIASVERHTPSSAEVVVHDNWPKNENLGVLWNRLMGGLGPSVRDVIILNPDTEVRNSWSAELRTGLKRGYAAVGPVTNSCGHGAQIRAKPETARRYAEVQALSGFCFAIRRKALDELNGFREDFPLYGQDSEMFMRLRRRGQKLALAPHVFILHHRSASGRDAQRRGELRLERARLQGTRPYARAVAKERKSRPRVLGVVRRGHGQQLSVDSLRESGLDEVHVVSAKTADRFIRARRQFFEAALCVSPGRSVRTSKESVLDAAAGGRTIDGAQLIRLPSGDKYG